MTSILLRDHENIFGIKYSLACDPGTYHIPLSRLIVAVNILLNGVKVSPTSECGVTWQKLFATALFWKSLMYDVEEEQGDSTVYLVLRCNLFPRIAGDFTHLPVGSVRHLDVTFECWTPSLRIHFDTLTHYLQYTFTSMVLNLEYKYPFVFSTYGKRLVKVNYAALLRVGTELATPIDASTNESTSVLDKNQIIWRCVAKLHAFILYDYNTLNVMIECETQGYRRQMCRNRPATSFLSRSIKNSAFCLAIPAPDWDES